MDPQTAQANSCGDPTRMELDRIDRHRSTTQSRSAADLFITLAGALGGSRDYPAASAVSLPASEYSEQDRAHLSHLRKPNSTSHARLLVEPGDVDCGDAPSSSEELFLHCAA
jgi:hypothetical protein